MDPFSIALNDLLVNSFHMILKLEEETLKSMSGNKLSISELHMLEAIHREPEKGRTITDIAQDLSITLPTVTVAVGKLAQKGYVRKDKGREDGRTVHVLLTEEGRRAEAAHRFFHRRMVQAVSRNIPQEEREVLLKGLRNLQAFLLKQEQNVHMQNESIMVQGDEAN
jgi:DNA-binding MarR family transcriptional regulator